MEKTAVYTNDDKLKIDLVNKFNKPKMKPHHFDGMAYLVNDDVFVSHLCLEMWHTDYKLVNAEDFLNRK